MDAQQELFTQLLVELKALGYDVYDGALPPENTPYPFVYLGDSQQNDSGTKAGVLGDVTQTIHVWHCDAKKRGTVSGMLSNVKKVCRGIEYTKNGWVLQDINQRIITDNTTKTPLLHGILEVGYRIS